MATPWHRTSSSMGKLLVTHDGSLWKARAALPDWNTLTQQIVITAYRTLNVQQRETLYRTEAHQPGECQLQEARRPDTQVRHRMGRSHDDRLHVQHGRSDLGPKWGPGDPMLERQTIHNGIPSGIAMQGNGPDHWSGRLPCIASSNHPCTCDRQRSRTPLRNRVATVGGGHESVWSRVPPSVRLSEGVDLVGRGPRAVLALPFDRRGRYRSVYIVSCVLVARSLSSSTSGPSACRTSTPWRASCARRCTTSSTNP